MRRAVVAALLLLLAGCNFERQPLQPGESYRIDVAVSGGGERLLAFDVQPDFGSPLGGSVGLTDVTTLEDSLDAIRRIRIDGLRPADPRNRGKVLPTLGHIELKALAARPFQLVFLYKGHSDVYHVSFPPDHLVLIEPPAQEFTRVFVKR